jgi:hypothetical protein
MLKKWFKWEFWPYWFFYIPIYFYVLYLGLKSRNLSFFTSANPGMKLGGFVDYSKWEVLKHLPKNLIPITCYYEKVPDFEMVEKDLQKNRISYPLIAKPDKGERGFGVEIIRSREDLQQYLKKFTQDVLIQEYVSTGTEFGVLYYRMPDQKRGKISSVVIKQILQVEGDGSSSFEQLIDNHPRCSYYRDQLDEEYSSEYHTILKKGEKRKLLEIGNHCRGATFLNGNKLISEKLVSSFEQAANSVPGFYLGRFDVKADSEADLENGNYKVIELNGVNSEPAHIYDPNNSLGQAYKDLRRHWQIIYKISRQNIKQGHPSSGLSSLFSHTQSHLKHKRSLT